MGFFFFFLGGGGGHVWTKTKTWNSFGGGVYSNLNVLGAF